MIELERKFLLKKIPPGLKDCPSKEVIDVYFPANADHPKIRLRKNGDKYELTKKVPEPGNNTRLVEQTITLTKEEFEGMQKFPGKRLHKIRYFYPYEGITAEIGIFQEGLEGLAIVEFEFETEEEKNSFVPPDFCLVELSEKGLLAGGYLAGRRYEDFQNIFTTYSYKKVIL